MMYKDNFVAVVKCDGKILREREGSVVYLPFGAEYSVLMKNKDARKALVEIEVDGENVLGGHKLVLNGNTSQEIKGFMRNMTRTNRFKFIKKTKEIQNHRGDRIDDGLVRVTYQFEKPLNIVHPPIYFSGNSTWTLTNNSTFSSSYSCDSSTPISYKSVAPRPDEGITVKGENIRQDYTYGSIGELECNTHTIILQLRGMTRGEKSITKPLTVKTKIRCETCGRRNRSTNKFCYNCGTYLT